MRRSSVAALVACLALAGLTSATSAVEASDGQDLGVPQALDTPFAKTWLILGWGQLGDQSEANIHRIATTYDWINTHGGSWIQPVHNGLYPMGGTVAERLRAVNPDIILTNYRNGSYTNQYALAEAGDVEANLPMAIAVHDTGAKLTAPLSDSTTTLVLDRPPGVVDPRVPAAQRPVYPFKASTTAATHTIDKHQYVAWLRIGDEIMRIDDVQPADGERIELTVVRGHWGTTASEHPADALVLQPVYNGRVMPNGNEFQLSGVPDGNSAAQPAVRYVMQQQRPEYWEWLGDIIQEIFDQGYDGPWFDTTISSRINHADAFGVPERVPYDVDIGQPLQRETYREYQQMKLQALFDRYPGREMYANWFFPQHYFDNGTERLMFSGDNGYHPISGGAIEQFVNPQFMEWSATMEMVLDMVEHDHRAVAWVKGFVDGQNMPVSYQHFAYASYLLAFEQDGELFYGHDFVPVPGPGVGVPDPPAFFYWNPGDPLERFTDIADAELAGAPGVYGREFACGKALVNPGFEEAGHVALDEPYYDPVAAEWVDEVTVGPRSGVVLLQHCPQGPECTTVMTGVLDGPLTVEEGVACVHRATVTGPVQVSGGAGLLVNRSTVEGPVTAEDAGEVVVCQSTVVGPVNVTAAAAVTLGDPLASCAGNVVDGPVRVRDTAGASVLAGNSVTGPLVCTGNEPAPVNRGVPNTVEGPSLGQCADL